MFNQVWKTKKEKGEKMPNFDHRQKKTCLSISKRADHTYREEGCVWLNPSIILLPYALKPQPGTNLLTNTWAAAIHSIYSPTPFQQLYAFLSHGWKRKVRSTDRFKKIYFSKKRTEMITKFVPVMLYRCCCCCCSKLRKKKENGFELSLILKSPWALFWESAEKREREPLG